MNETEPLPFWMHGVGGMELLRMVSNYDGERWAFPESTLLGKARVKVTWMGWWRGGGEKSRAESERHLEDRFAWETPPPSGAFNLLTQFHPNSTADMEDLLSFPPCIAVPWRTVKISCLVYLFLKNPSMVMCQVFNITFILNNPEGILRCHFQSFPVCPTTCAPWNENTKEPRVNFSSRINGNKITKRQW